MGWPPAYIEGARPLAKGHKCAGRAVTLRMVPARPDIAADKPGLTESPEYEAFEKCGPNEVLVISSVGPWESVGGDIKFLRLKQARADASTPAAPRVPPPRAPRRPTLTAARASRGQLGMGGIVTDGSVRDTDELLGYGFPVFSYSTTAKQARCVTFSISGVDAAVHSRACIPSATASHCPPLFTYSHRLRGAGTGGHAAVGVRRRDRVR